MHPSDFADQRGPWVQKYARGLAAAGAPPSAAAAVAAANAVTAHEATSKADPAAATGGSVPPPVDSLQVPDPHHIHHGMSVPSVGGA